MRLDQYPDFAAIVAAATDHLRAQGQPKIREEHVEKDYWVTEVLRSCHAYLGDRALFKGGTSLLKGYGIIRRFSEDVDLAVATTRDGSPMSSGQIKDDLSRLVKAVGSHPGLTRDEDAKRVAAGMRDEVYTYEGAYRGTLPQTVKLEVGTRSGQHPDSHRAIDSLVAAFLRNRDVTLEGVEVADPFNMRLMDYRRTFVEKLYAIHSEVERFVEEGRDLGSRVRHYYDLHSLAQEGEVLAFLGSDEYDQVRHNYAEICRSHFPSSRLPKAMDLTQSRALFPDDKLSRVLEDEYQIQISALSFEESPATFEDVKGTFEKLRGRLGPLSDGS